MRRIRPTEQADADILDIWQYIAVDNEAAADAIVDRFTDTYYQLARNPRMGITQEQYRPRRYASKLNQFSPVFQRFFLFGKGFRVSTALRHAT